MRLQLVASVHQQRMVATNHVWWAATVVDKPFQARLRLVRRRHSHHAHDAHVAVARNLFIAQANLSF